ncbi:unnamed protein product [Psylliodes chrysocephalus]|uniref:Peptidase C1A papain C-terminal domain-containing protein n=1 Tax=Psylliodes chrysocephalus TaxID=3402493 RepID=A0A9P0D4S8_9CUCU|nr:unnamed protein product [Psylliodes chrysocephala]
MSVITSNNHLKPPITFGIYHHVRDRSVGQFGLRLLGWGVENDEPYWLAANSWNEDFGEKGLMRIRRGVNECNIEDDPCKDCEEKKKSEANKSYQSLSTYVTQDLFFLKKKHGTYRSSDWFVRGEIQLVHLYKVCILLRGVPEGIEVIEGKLKSPAPLSDSSTKENWNLIAKTERTVNNLTTQLCTYEKALTSKQQGSGEEILSAEKSKSNKSKKRCICNYCKQVGHKVRQCTKWKKDGRPPKPESGNKEQERPDRYTNMSLSIMDSVLNVETDHYNWYVDNKATNHVNN